MTNLSSSNSTSGDSAVGSAIASKKLKGKISPKTLLAVDGFQSIFAAQADAIPKDNLVAGLVGVEDLAKGAIIAKSVNTSNPGLSEFSASGESSIDGNESLVLSQLSYLKGEDPGKLQKLGHLKQMSTLDSSSDNELREEAIELSIDASEIDEISGKTQKKSSFIFAESVPLKIEAEGLSKSFGISISSDFSSSTLASRSSSGTPSTDFFLENRGAFERINERIERLQNAQSLGGLGVSKSDSVSVVLRPESLGQIDLKIMLFNGDISVEIKASRETVDVLSLNLEDLKKEIRATEIRVTESNESFSSSNDQQPQSKDRGGSEFANFNGQSDRENRRSLSGDEELNLIPQNQEIDTSTRVENVDSSLSRYSTITVKA